MTCCCRRRRSCGTERNTSRSSVLLPRRTIPSCLLIGADSRRAFLNVLHRDGHRRISSGPSSSPTSRFAKKPLDFAKENKDNGPLMGHSPISRQLSKLYPFESRYFDEPAYSHDRQRRSRVPEPYCSYNNQNHNKSGVMGNGKFSKLFGRQNKRQTIP